MCNDTILKLSIGQPAQSMESSSRLERSYSLVVFTLEKQVNLWLRRLLSFIFGAD
jgi:hypothetical protein